MNDYERPSGANGMGITGFVIGLVSILTCGGCISPIGLIFSLIGMGKEPRGLAVAGLVLNILGTLLLLAWALLPLFGVVLFAGLFATLLAAVGAAGFVMVGDATLIQESAESYERANGSWPTSIDQLGLDSTVTTDVWGNEYRLEALPEGGVALWSNGPDGVADTGDDIQLLPEDQGPMGGVGGP